VVGGDDRAGPGANRLPERLLVSIVALGAVATLFTFRALDDNRLTSWRWVFAASDAARLLALVGAGVVAANFAARLQLPRRPGTVLFLASYAVAALFWGAPEVIVDASRYFAQAKSLEVHGPVHFLREWGREIPAWTDLPLVPFLYGLVLALFGETRVHLQAFTTLLFAGSVVLTYRIGKVLWDDEVGFLGGAFLLGIPYLLPQVPVALVDVPTMFFLALALLAVIQALRRGGPRRVLLASLAVFLAALCKYSTWPMLSVLAVAWLAHRQAPGSARTAGAIGLLFAVLLAAPLLARRDVFSEQLQLLWSYQAVGLRRWGESLASTFLFQVHPFLTAAALASALLAWRRRDPSWLVVAWPVLLLLALQVRRARYTLPTFPMLALMGAYGLQALRESEWRRLVLACAVASSLVVALYGYLPFLRGTSAMNLERAGAYLDSIEETRALVFTLPQGSEVNPAVAVPLLDLYTGKELRPRGAPEAPPPAIRLRESALRFTWEFRMPGYAAVDGADEDAAVVVVSADAREPLPDEVAGLLQGHRLARVLAQDEGVFRFRTLVRVYRRAPP
jgi:hypothetical protein